MKLLISIVLVACAGCGGGSAERRMVPMTPELIATHGSRTFAAPRARTTQATAAALRNLGYDVAVEDPEADTLETKRLLIDSQSGAVVTTVSRRTYVSSSPVIGETVQLVARFSNAPGGGTTVRLEPRRYRGDTDVTSSMRFDEQELQEQWSQMFGDIEAALSAPR